MDLSKLWMYFEQDSGGNDGGDPPADGDTTATEDAPASFDDWLSSQPDTIKTLVDGHTDGLRSALTNESEERKKATRQLKALQDKAEKGSDLEKEIERLIADNESSDRKARFYESAHTAGVKNLRLAYLAATDGDLFDKDGDVNFDKLKEQAPELFASEDKKPPPRGNAGSGQNQGGGTVPSMNGFIRAATGRR